MRVLQFLFLLHLALAGWSIEAPAVKAKDPDEDEKRSKERFESLQREAADYRVARAKHRSDPLDDALAFRALDEARQLRSQGDRHRLGLIGPVTFSRWRAESAIDDHPYSAAVGELFHFVLDRRAEDNDLVGVRDTLARMWYQLPDYPRMGEAMSTALDASERAQDFAAAVDLEAPHPADVIRIKGSGMADSATMIFRFLAEHGDRETVGPRASLGIARSLMLSAERADRWLARREYERFTEEFPDHPLVFDAIIEQALSHLVMYRGDDYDSGALSAASDLVELAALETAKDQSRLRTVQAWRVRIVGWQQARDLRIARWYRARGNPAIISWLRTPSGLQDWTGGARIYYQAAIRRDRASPQAREAERELAELRLDAASALLDAPGAVQR